MSRNHDISTKNMCDRRVGSTLNIINLKNVTKRYELDKLRNFWVNKCSDEKISFNIILSSCVLSNIMLNYENYE